MAAPARKFYGRRHGKALKPGQRRALSELLPRLAVRGVAPQENPQRTPLDPAAIFGSVVPLWLEVGFGGGEHLVAQAAANPQVGLIGCEPFVNGVAAALGRIAVAGVENVRIHPGDARDLIELLPEGALARIFLLYPDPWPKTRHHKRRFMSPENLAALGRAAAAGAELRLATDIADYARHALAAAEGSLWRWRAGDLRRPWPDWPSTRYEAKALRAGRDPQYLTFVRR